MLLILHLPYVDSMILFSQIFRKKKELDVTFQKCHILHIISISKYGFIHRKSITFETYEK